MAGRAYFVIGCHRSGTTSLARILNGATNGCCLSEPAPNLNREARDRMDGRPMDARRVVEAAVGPRLATCELEVYGEKNAPLGAFLPELRQLFDCRFVVVVRDGRDVVRSLIDWHEGLFGNIYHECREPSALSELAREAVARLPAERDESDYFRCRPRPDEPLARRWAALSRAEMAAFFWSRYNDHVFDSLNTLPRECWTLVDYTNPTPDAILDAARFVGLEGLDADRIGAQLGGRINSLQDRTGESGRYPSWPQWSSTQMERFRAIAGDTMIRLGYEERR